MTPDPSRQADRYGPNTAWVERVVDEFLNTADISEVFWYFRNHFGPSWRTAAEARERSQRLAREQGRDAFQRAAYDDTYQLSVEASGCAAEDLNYAVAETAAAVVVQDLLDPRDFDLLVAPWTALFGDRSAASVIDDPPVWPPRLVHEPSCGRPCVHGAAHAMEAQ
jgi:hypothetical protein